MIVEGFTVADFPSKEEVTQSASLISHTPEKYYDIELRDYETFIKKIIDILKDLPKERVQEFLDWASKGYIDRYREMLHFRGRVASPLVVGPSKFPSQERNLESLRKREEELESFKEKVLKKAKRLAKSRGLSEIEATKKEIEELKHTLEVMKEANKIIRSKKLSKEEKERKLREIGAFEIKGYPFYWPEPDYMGRLGFPSFDLDSVRRKIKQREERLKRLEEKEGHKGEVNVVKETKDYKIVEDYTKDRVLIYFTEIPSEEVREALKRRGFRWSPHWKAWSRKLTKAAVVDAEEILAKFYKSEGEKLKTKKSYSTKGLRRRFYKDSEEIGFYEMHRNGELAISMYGFYIPEHEFDYLEIRESEIREHGWDEVCKRLRDYTKEYTDYVCEYLKKDFDEMKKREAEKKTEPVILKVWRKRLGLPEELTEEEKKVMEKMRRGTTLEEVSEMLKESNLEKLKSFYRAYLEGLGIKNVEEEMKNAEGDIKALAEAVDKGRITLKEAEDRLKLIAPPPEIKAPVIKEEKKREIIHAPEIFEAPPTEKEEELWPAEIRVMLDEIKENPRPIIHLISKGWQKIKEDGAYAYFGELGVEYEKIIEKLHNSEEGEA